MEAVEIMKSNEKKGCFLLGKVGREGGGKNRGGKAPGRSDSGLGKWPPLWGEEMRQSETRTRGLRRVFCARAEEKIPKTEGGEGIPKTGVEGALSSEGKNSVSSNLAGAAEWTKAREAMTARSNAGGVWRRGESLAKSITRNWRSRVSLCGLCLPQKRGKTQIGSTLRKRKRPEFDLQKRTKIAINESPRVRPQRDSENEGVGEKGHGGPGRIDSGVGSQHAKGVGEERAQRGRGTKNNKVYK